MFCRRFASASAFFAAASALSRISVDGRRFTGCGVCCRLEQILAAHDLEEVIAVPSLRQHLRHNEQPLLLGCQFAQTLEPVLTGDPHVPAWCIRRAHRPTPGLARFDDRPVTRRVVPVVSVRPAPRNSVSLVNPAR